MGVADRDERLRSAVEGAGGTLRCRVDTLLHHFEVSGYRADREALSRGLERAGLVAEPDVTEAEPDQIVLLRGRGPGGSVAAGPGPSPTAVRGVGGSLGGRAAAALSGDSARSIALSVAGFLVVCALVGYGFGRALADEEAGAAQARDEAVALSTRAAARPAYAAAVKRGRARGRARGAREGRSRGARDGAERGRLRALASPPAPPPAPTPPTPTPAPARPRIPTVPVPPARAQPPPAVPAPAPTPTPAPAPPTPPQTGTGR